MTARCRFADPEVGWVSGGSTMPHRILCLSYACPVVNTRAPTGALTALSGAEAPGRRPIKVGKWMNMVLILLMQLSGLVGFGWQVQGATVEVCPSGRGGRRGLLGRKQQDSATPPDVADSYSANLGLIPIWAKGNDKEAFENPKGKGKDGKGKKGKGKGKDRPTVMRSCVSEDVSLSSPAVSVTLPCV